MKKIAVIRRSYSPYGGAEQLTLSLLRRILKCDVEVMLLTWKDQKWPLDSPKLTVKEFGRFKWNRLVSRYFFNRTVGSFLDHYPFDIILSIDEVDHFTHLHAGGGCHREFLKQKLSSAGPVEKLMLTISLFHRFRLAVIKSGFIQDRLKKVHCCSTMVYEELKRHYDLPQDLTVIIPNSVDWHGIGTVFEQREEVGRDLMEKHHLSSANEYLLFLGSGFNRKGLDLAMLGLAFMDESRHLVVIGKDNIEKWRKKADAYGISDRVHFLGPQINGWKYASFCKALVLPSRYEPFGLVCAEVQAMGLPVLISSRTGYAELVKPHSGVILEESCSEATLKTAFNELETLIEKPIMSAIDIRQSVSHLDHSIIHDRMMTEFLGLEDYCYEA